MSLPVVGWGVVFRCLFVLSDPQVSMLNTISGAFSLYFSFALLTLMVVPVWVWPLTAWCLAQATSQQMGLKALRLR